MKRFRSFLAIFLALVLLTSCGKPAAENPAPEPPAAPAQTEAPAAPAEPGPQVPAAPEYDSQPLFYEAWSNPLSSEETEEFHDPGNITYPVISGLKNSRLETSINHKIVNQVRRAAQWPIPPYRGTGALDIPTFEGDSSRGFWISIPFSCNDYLSFMGSYNLTDDNFSHNFSDIWTMTYDLRTGKEIRLADLFAPGYDYKAVINERVAQALCSQGADTEYYRDDSVFWDWSPIMEIEYDSVKLVAPFKGIRDDQRFYLSQYGLFIVLNYENPELDFVGHYIEPFTVSISYSDFGDGLLLARGCNRELYHSGIDSRKVLILSLGGKMINEKVPLYTGDLPITADLLFTYPEHMDPGILEKMKAELESSAEPLSEYIRACRKDPDQSYYFNYTAYAQINGPYTAYNLMVSVPPLQDDGEYYNYENYHTFDRTGRELSPEDFFDRNFNARDHLVQMFQEDYDSIRAFGNHADFDPDFRDMADAAKVYVSSFGIAFNAPYSILVSNDEYHYTYYYRPMYDVAFDSDEALLLKY